ncbi:MAG: sulfatase-like hydrolase/transferase [Bacillota bacterium]
MNIIYFIADSLNIDNTKNMTFQKKCQVVLDNHWTNATWTVPALAHMITGLIPTIVCPVYDSKPHKIKIDVARKIPLFRSLHNKYYIMVSSPWQMVAEIIIHLIQIYGINFLRTDSPYVCTKDIIKKDSYYEKRFSRRLGIDLSSCPKPFFHVCHNTRTHSEFGLTPNEFSEALKKGPDYLSKFQERQSLLLDQELNTIYNSMPEDTMLIFTSDHGEDFNEICENHECGHATNYNKETMNVPLMMAYKGHRELNCNISKQTSHDSLYKELVNWVKLDKEENISFKEMENESHLIMFTQGSQIGEDSIKFLNDVVVGVFDFNKKISYTQSMITEEEKTNKDISFKERDEYRNLVLSDKSNLDQNLNWTSNKAGVEPAFDEF